MDQEKTNAVSRAETTSGQGGMRRWLSYLPQGLIWVRYILPVATCLAVLVIGFFYNVKIMSGAAIQELSVCRLYANTFIGMHRYLGSNAKAGRMWFFGILVAGAILGILLFLAALFFAGLAAYTAARAFLAGHESEESDKYKLIFKIAFPNRYVLFLSNLLVLLPLFYPHFVSFVGSRFLAISGTSVIFILLNRPLIVAGALSLVSLVLALVIPRYERRKKMNMFLLHRALEEKSEEKIDEDFDEESEE